MPSDVVFFPWVSIEEPLHAGPLRLLPYERGRLPGDTDFVEQSDLDLIFGAYANRPRKAVGRATLLEYGDWRSGMDSTNLHALIFRARAYVGVAALAKRRLFVGHFGYCNFDTYALVIQSIAPGLADHFSFTSRRRDTGTRHRWSSKDFAFFRPNHVDTHAKANLDVPLLTALLSLGKSYLYIANAIQEFDFANTDSLDVAEHIEMVMMKSAFESLLRIGTKADQFVSALRKTLDGSIETKGADGPLADRWRARWKTARTPIEAWARDFCDVRGAAAHGGQRSPDRFVWDQKQHLAFASTFFPVLLKKHLADETDFRMGDYDVEILKRIERFLMFDPLTPEGLEDPARHPWIAIESEAQSATFEKTLRALYASEADSIPTAGSDAGAEPADQAPE